MSGTLPTEDSRAFAGVPDGFDRLWTPYRMAYINGDHKPADSSSEECPFCVASRCELFRSDESLPVQLRASLGLPLPPCL